MPVSEDDVIAAYRLILGREPDSEASVKAHTSIRNMQYLREAFLNSEEFRRKYAGREKANVRDLVLYLPVVLPPHSIDVASSTAERRQLLKRVAGAWSELGRKRPHHSVLTNPRFLPDSIDLNIEEFDQSGTDDMNIVRSVLARCVPSFELKSAEVTEYGCGMGRVTAHLAGACKTVFACDVSEPYLDLAKARLAAAGIGNVSFHLVTEDELSPAPECDLWFSRIVLQHNPPPIIAAILERSLAKIRPGGVALFQVPTYKTNYVFNLREYLKWAPARNEMEMHVLPQHEIFRIAASCGLRAVEVREDNSVGSPHTFVSNLFCFVKPKPGKWLRRIFGSSAGRR